jgi:hypothetical protein
VAANAAGFLVTIHCAPEVLPNQSVSLALGPTAVPAQSFDALTPVLSFQFPPLGVGIYLARLMVDGVESPVSLATGPWVTV